MIFKTLTLNNFRVFNDETTIDLSPRRDGVLEKNIILFGGLNGAGKTSILTATRLALLGKRALGQAIHKKDYQAYLTEQINKAALKDDGNSSASIILEFTHTHQGKHNHYTIERTWTATREEKVTIAENGQLDHSLNSEQVQSFLHELVPPGIGDLFFFDGEKIAELAEDDTGSYLKEAVQKLLGLDVINRLGDDLDIYIKQITKDTASADTIRKIGELEAEKAKYLRYANKRRDFENELNSLLAEVNKDIAKLEQKIEERGGAWAKTKDQEKSRADDLIKQQTKLESSILSELSSSFPMSLAPTAMQNLLDELNAEKQTKDAKAFNEQLVKNFDGLQASLNEQFSDTSNDIMANINQYFAKQSAASVLEAVILDVSDTGLAAINAQIADAELAKKHINKLNTELSTTQNELANLSTNIERAPDENELAELFKELRKLDSQRAALKTRYMRQLLKAKNFVEKALENAKRLEKLYTSQKTESSITKAIQRVDTTQNVLNEFSTELTQLRVCQLEELFVKSYQKLARKGDLKLSAKINSKTFDVNLVDQDGITINRKSMSAGEKQIFAFAILEALGKLSGKVLPVVVDTPLGRLDSKHRNKLITHYFPEAAEQVIILSTDTEVDEQFYTIMSKNISHAFEIEFDQETKCSTLSEGYFWAEKVKEAV
ncbi:DNA sulfur modification protein DndD [Thalassomonas haliotis]|uniref:DNA sulfur modification protein DndD n=1 Tax=Thalassomonas haliotis TaxID=485448 RepID=A0ABY7VJC3_9GAMM|nr:DNA sulfur modification protein DndD [Thalassomonas haliotis]WDE13492.1 DNA sulfur modification protein DndD [Thalassomonas haliotis]